MVDKVETPALDAFIERQIDNAKIERRRSMAERFMAAQMANAGETAVAMSHRKMAEAGGMDSTRYDKERLYPLYAERAIFCADLLIGLLEKTE